MINTLWKNNSYRQSLQLSIHWLLFSGIQHPEGGFHAWYDSGEQTYAYLYPEVTGYALRLLIQLYRKTTDKQQRSSILSMIRKAGNWLSMIITQDGSFCCRYQPDTQATICCDHAEYVFDVGICMTGLLELFEVTDRQLFCDLAQNMGEFLLKFQNSDGSISAGVHPEFGRIENPHWSQTRGCHHIKDVIAILKLYEFTHNQDLITSADKLLHWGIELQDSQGRFPISQYLPETYTHAHCYAVEGLLKASEFFKEPLYLNAAKLGAQWLAKSQNADGSLWSHYNTQMNRTRLKVNDALVQAIRIWIVLYQKGYTQFSSNILQGLKYLERMQCILDHNTRTKGGYYYGRKEKQIIVHINCCITIFMIQTLLFLERSDEPNLEKLLL
jgi:uncharacterized protein YyaL (SSP411 family)